MFWIPGISLLVFFLILVPSTILGYKKGWRGAIIVSLLLLSFTGIWIGVGYAIYDSLLWGLYRDHILARDLRVSGLNLDSLAGDFKLRVVLLFTGALTPFSYLFVWGIWKLSREKINKYMGPKTKEVNAHEKKLIYRKHATPSRVAGLTIMGGTTLFIASMTASAVSVITVPYSHRDGMTKMNDRLGQLYGFGQIGNTESASALQSFMKEVDANMITALQQLNYVSTETDNNWGDVDNSKALFKGNGGMRWEVLEDLMKASDEAAAMFVKMSLESGKQYKNDPLWWDPTNFGSTPDSHGNTVAYAGTARTNMLPQLMAYYQSHAHEFKFTPLVTQAFINHLKKTITSFDQSIYAQAYNNEINKLHAHQNSFAALKHTLDQKKTELSNKQATLARLVNEIKLLNGQEYVVNPNDLTVGKTTYNSETVNYNTYTPGTQNKANTTLEKAEQVVADIDTRITTYQPTHQSAKNDFDTKKAAYVPIDAQNTRYASAIKTAQGNYDFAQGKLKEHQITLAKTISDISNYENIQKNINDTIAKLDGNKTRLNGEITTANNNILTLTNQIDNAPTGTDTSALEKQRSDAQILLTNLQTQLSANNQELKDKQTEKGSNDFLLKQAQTDKTNLEQNIIPVAELNVSNFKSQLDISKAEYNNFQSTFLSAKTAYENADRVYQQSVNHMNSLISQRQNAGEEVNKITTRASEITNQIQTNSSDSSGVATEILNLITINTNIANADVNAQLPATTNIFNTDDGTLEFLRKAIKYDETVKSNLKVIYDSKLNSHNEYKNKLIDLYSKWIRGENV